uniref:Cytochrome c oxidase subunit 3 n=1 Tax=Endelus continentalis TaxID=2984121 RepID=A0A977TQ01_9COLE|nr:cytochrome c oxidase subunit III [Endelus continentalis]UXX50476.1 cytochrome c oxidase subunit III [Endelus continentalis]
MSKHNHPFHLVSISPWPLFSSMGIMVMMLGIINWFHHQDNLLLMIGIIIMVIICTQWWRDMCREGTMQGNHTNMVTLGLKWGMLMFITSEILFFISFFWSFFHSSLSPSIEIGMMWPPKGISPFNPIQIPLLNTLILLSSGITITWAHHSMMENNYKETNQGLLITICLGLYFSMLQMYEYMEAPFTISDSIYGSTFFMATGFHGIHVIVGTLFLSVCLTRQYKNHFSNHHHLGFESAAWYWHFVDVVWLFLYMSIYWWGS